MNQAHKLVTPAQTMKHSPYIQQSQSTICHHPITYINDSPYDHLQPVSTIHENHNATDANQQQQSVSIASTTVDEKEYTEKSVSPCTPLSPLLSTPSSNHGAFLIFLDWDDTLYPSTRMMQILNRTHDNGLVFVTNDEKEQWNQLGINTLSLLRRLIYKYGAHSVHIVSNSEEGWILQSLQLAQCISKIYKDIAVLLVDNDITMISAQSTYSAKVPHSNPTTWKILCFVDILHGDKCMPSYSHILSIGDQWVDHHAAVYSIQSLNRYTPLHHMIKVKEDPSLNDMINEMLYIETAFDLIFSGDIVAPVIMDYSVEENRYTKSKEYSNH